MRPSMQRWKKRLNSLLPNICMSIGAWFEGGKQGPPPVISLAGSSKPSCVAPVVQSPAVNPNSGRDDHMPAGDNADGTEESSAVTTPRRSPPVWVTPPTTVRGLSLLGELNALMVIKRRKSLNKLHITSFFSALSNALHMFSQADEMRCTLLLRVKGQLMDVKRVRS